MVFIDTGYLIALFTEADDLHERAVAWSEVCDERLLVTEQVLIETANHFRHPKNRARASGIWDWVISDPQCEFVPASSVTLEAGWKMFASRPDKEWSLTDCISFWVMSDRGVTHALAHDIHFERAGFVPLLRRDP